MTIDTKREDNPRFHEIANIFPLMDEESFAAKTGHPSYWTTREAEAIRAEGHRVARLAETGAFPFDGSWCDFTPPSSWALPELPPRPPSPVLNLHDKRRG